MTNTFILEGNEPVEDAHKALEAYSEESVKSIKIELTKHNRMSGGASSLSNRETEQSEIVASEDGATPQPDNSDKGRAKREISENTSHHRVLHTLAESGSDGPLPVREIKQRVTNVSESSISPALTQLWKRELVQRERVEDVPNPYYKYWVSEYGETILEQLGNPDEGVD